MKIHMPFEHRFWLKSVDLIGHSNLMLLFAVETMMAYAQEVLCFSVSLDVVKAIFSEIFDGVVIVKLEERKHANFNA